MASAPTTPPILATPAPTTPAPIAPAPTTAAPTVPAPTTAAPTTPAPTTPATATPAPTTLAPTNPAPSTAAPITPAPTTPVPTTGAATPATTPATTTPPATLAPSPESVTPAPTATPSGTRVPSSTPVATTPLSTPGTTPSPPGATPVPPSTTSAPANGNAAPSSSFGNQLESTGLSSGAVAGIAIGASLAAVLLLAILVAVLCCRGRRKKRYADYQRSPRRASQNSMLPVKGSPPTFHQNGARLNQPQPAQANQQVSPIRPQGPPQPPPPKAQPLPVARIPSQAKPESPHLASKIFPPPPPPAFNLGNSRMEYSYQELAAATENFAPARKVGEGGFGKVYQGELKDGRVVAVKQLLLGGGQGEREFRAEVEIISRVHHRHLVNLVGYCIVGENRLLVYEFMFNGTLESHLHAKEKAALDWPTRMKIAVGAARGLAYLHEDAKPKIIHRDIKGSNILLDENFEAQVSDFGLAKSTQDQASHVSTRVMGTFGYLAPEYAMTGKLTDKSDVYSFGVVLLELLTGRRPVDMEAPPGLESLVEWARPLLQQENVNELVDPRLQGKYNSDEAKRMLRAAMLCIRSTAAKRPRLGQVVRMLEGESDLDFPAGGRTSIGPNVPLVGGVYETENFSGGQTTGSQEVYGARRTPLAMEPLTYSFASTSGQNDSMDFSTPILPPPPPPPGGAPFASPSRAGSMNPQYTSATPSRGGSQDLREVVPVDGSTRRFSQPSASPSRAGSLSTPNSLQQSDATQRQQARPPPAYTGQSVIFSEDLEEGR